MKIVKHVKYEYIFYIYEHDHVIEYDDNGHIIRQYMTNAKRTRKNPPT